MFENSIVMIGLVQIRFCHILLMRIWTGSTGLRIISQLLTVCSFIKLNVMPFWIRESSKAEISYQNIEWLINHRSLRKPWEREADNICQKSSLSSPMANASTTLFALSSSIPTRLSLPRRSESLKLVVPVAMASSASTAKKVAPAVIVGDGRVGRALQEMGSGDDLLVKRGEPVPVDFEGPIFVCTRNDDLDAVLEATPQSRWKGLNFTLSFMTLLFTLSVPKKIIVLKFLFVS